MNEYTPTVEELAKNTTIRDRRVVALTREERTRGIARVRADALREAARDMRAQVERATEHQRFTEHELVESGVEHVLNEYADRIEREARDGR